MVTGFKLHFLNYSYGWTSFQVFRSHLFFILCELFISFVLKWVSKLISQLCKEVAVGGSVQYWSQGRRETCWQKLGHWLGGAPWTPGTAHTPCPHVGQPVHESSHFFL